MTSPIISLPDVAKAYIANQVDHIVELENITHQTTILMQVEALPLISRDNTWPYANVNKLLANVAKSPSVV